MERTGVAGYTKGNPASDGDQLAKRGNDGFGLAAGGIRNLIRQRFLARPRIDQDAPAALQEPASSLCVTLDGPALCAPSGAGVDEHGGVTGVARKNGVGPGFRGWINREPW